MLAPLIIHMDAGCKFDLHSIRGTLIEKWDKVELPSGESIGVVWATTLKTRAELEKEPGIHVVPGSIKVPKVLDATTLTKLSIASPKATDTTMDLGEKLFALTGMPWFHPEWEPS